MRRDKSPRNTLIQQDLWLWRNGHSQRVVIRVHAPVTADAGDDLRLACVKPAGEEPVQLGPRPLIPARRKGWLGGHIAALPIEPGLGHQIEQRLVLLWAEQQV